LIALAFLPIDQVAATFLILLENDVPEMYHDEDEGGINHPGLLLFLEYFATQWLENESNLNKFNCFNRIDRRTNNDMEGFNLKMRLLLKIHNWFKNHGLQFLFG